MPTVWPCARARSAVRSPCCGSGVRGQGMGTPGSRRSSVTCPIGGAGPATIQGCGFETPALTSWCPQHCCGRRGTGPVHRPAAQLAGWMPPCPCGISFSVLSTADCSVASPTPRARHCARAQQGRPAATTGGLRPRGRSIAWITAHGRDRRGTEVQTGREAEGREGTTRGCGHAGHPAHVIRTISRDRLGASGYAAPARA